MGRPCNGPYPCLTQAPLTDSPGPGPPALRADQAGRPGLLTISLPADPADRVSADRARRLACRPVLQQAARGLPERSALSGLVLALPDLFMISD